jgi:hypothetical protein
VSTIGPNPAQLIAGIGNAERAAGKDVERTKGDKARVRSRRREDEVELSGGAEAAEAVRNVQDPTKEEGTQDRNAKERYGGRRADKPVGVAKRLDVSG